MRGVLRVSLVALAAAGAGCDERTADRPPDVRLGDSVCAECNMIISDVRWATATMVGGPRGPEPRLFDDFNCQVNYEVEHKDERVVARWSHDSASGGWIRTEQATFVLSPDLRSPMGSMMAAYAAGAENAAIVPASGGEVMSFEKAWAHLGADRVTGKTKSRELEQDDGS